ncbi:MAG: HEAT repeat domain-containing protein, partial [Verrucomicrobia bacterium]|nr:HEAT repeat domain-containing protein [Verrucomicrobiota bacterium]
MVDSLRMPWLSRLAALLAVLVPNSLPGAAPATPLTPEQILQKVTYPPEFAATVFAAPPDVSYPVFLSAAADGTLFIASDENGSLGREPNRGRVIRARDTDGDGRADHFTTFATMDSPRGVAWDQSTRTLYVMHPPDLTAYHDDNDDGVADRSTTLIAGLGFGLDFRGADHTTNGIRLGIDGWIYIAVGDYGAVRATGRDGRTLSLRGGGIVRVRPDGSGMEQVSSGQRNILAVAVSPTLDLFTRDNTNDGDDWNVRLSHVPVGAQMGYPTLFRNFSDEIIPPMVDYGGGSPVGSIFIDEPSLPRAWSQGFYSVEWGRNEITLHPLTPAGASWKADAIPFMKMTRANDLEVDGGGHLYAASWDGASFNFAGSNVGYLIRLVGKSAPVVAVPDFAGLTVPALVGHIGAGSGMWRLAAQRELLKRGTSAAAVDGLRRIAEAHALLAARVAAIFTLKLLQGAASHPALVALARQEAGREFALKALADDPRVADAVPAEPFVAALADTNPRVRLQAATGLGRLGQVDAAPALLKRTADADPTVAHIAVQALRTLRATEACFAALDDGPANVQRGALRVLQALPEPAVVDGLLRRLPTATGDRRVGIFTTLARLNTKEAPYTEPKMWWGTRPDTSGPLFKPERWAESDRIEAALKQQLEAATGAEARQFVSVVVRTKVNFPGLLELMLAKAGENTAARLNLIAPMISPKAPLPENLLAILNKVAGNPGEPVELRARALRLLVSTVDRNLEAVVAALAPFARSAGPAPLVTVWEEFARDPRHAKRVNVYSGLARDPVASKRFVGT